MAALAVGLPVVIYLVAVGLLHGWPVTARTFAPVAVTAVLIAATAAAAAWIGVALAVVTMSLIVAALVAVMVAGMRTDELAA